MTATFVGYGAAGLAGATVATFAIFLPAFIFAILASRFMTSFGHIPQIRAALKGISAAVVGAILAATIRLADSAFVDVTTVVIALLALALLLRFRIHSALLVGAAGLSGLALGALGAT
jgi:chromate transporter